MQWGLIPHWAAEYRQSHDKRPCRNADGTTFVQTARRSTPLHHPCGRFLRVAKRRQTQGAMWVHLKNKEEPFVMAGLWDVRRKPDGGEVESFTIITTVNARRIADKRIILS